MLKDSYTVIRIMPQIVHRFWESRSAVDAAVPGSELVAWRRRGGSPFRTHRLAAGPALGRWQHVKGWCCCSCAERAGVIRLWWCGVYCPGTMGPRLMTWMVNPFLVAALAVRAVTCSRVIPPREAEVTMKLRAILAVAAGATGIPPEGLTPPSRQLSLVNSGVLKMTLPQGYWGGASYEVCGQSASQADQQRYCPNG